MSSSNIQAAEYEIDGNESAGLIIGRLAWITCATIFVWCAILGGLYLVNFPAMPTMGRGAGGPSLISVRVAATILLANFGSVTLIQALAPQAVIRSRLISNTVFSSTILTLCIAVALVSQMVPAEAYAYFREAIVVGFQPSFLFANFALCSIAGLLIYRIRKTSTWDMPEIFWILGLTFLFVVSVAAVTAIVPTEVNNQGQGATWLDRF